MELWGVHSRAEVPLPIMQYYEIHDRFISRACGRAAGSGASRQRRPSPRAGEQRGGAAGASAGITVAAAAAARPAAVPAALPFAAEAEAPGTARILKGCQPLSKQIQQYRMKLSASFAQAS